MSEEETFDITIPVKVIFDPDRKSNRLAFRMSDTEVGIHRGVDDEKLGYAGAAIGGTLIAGVGEYICTASPMEFWKAIKTELEKTHENVIPELKEDKKDVDKK